MNEKLLKILKERNIKKIGLTTKSDCSYSICYITERKDYMVLNFSEEHIFIGALGIDAKKQSILDIFDVEDK